MFRPPAQFTTITHSINHNFWQVSLPIEIVLSSSLPQQSPCLSRSPGPFRLRWPQKVRLHNSILVGWFFPMVIWSSSRETNMGQINLQVDTGLYYMVSISLTDKNFYTSRYYVHRPWRTLQVVYVKPTVFLWLKKWSADVAGITKRSGWS